MPTIAEKAPMETVAISNFTHKKEKNSIINWKPVNNVGKSSFEGNLVLNKILSDIGEYFINLISSNDDVYNAVINLDFDEDTLLSLTPGYMKQVQKIENEFNKLPKKEGCITKLELDKLLKNSLFRMMLIKSDAFSVQFTQDSTLFYTIIKNDFTFFVEQFPEDEYNENDDYAITIFEKNEIIKNKSGSLSSIIKTINERLN